MAEWTGLEPATPGVTGRYSNQLNYHSACWWVLRGSNPRPTPCKGAALPAELSTRGAEGGRALRSVDRVLPRRAGAELRHLGGLDLERGAGARIAPAARGTLRHGEGA